MTLRRRAPPCQCFASPHRERHRRPAGLLGRVNAGHLCFSPRGASPGRQIFALGLRKAISASHSRHVDSCGYGDNITVGTSRSPYVVKFRVGGRTGGPPLRLASFRKTRFSCHMFVLVPRATQGTRHLEGSWNECLPGQCADACPSLPHQAVRTPVPGSAATGP